jgi:hypothetical protein
VSKSTEAKVAEFSMPRNAKPTRALGRDGTRPHLRDAYLKPGENGKATLYATDAYKLVVLAVEATGDFDPQYIAADALKAAEKSGRFQVGEYIEPLDKNGNANGVLFRKPEHTKGPADFEALFEKRAKPNREFTVGFNAEFLAQVAAAMGTDGVKVTFDADNPLSAILVEPLNAGVPGGEARGLIMPIRLNV